MATTIYTYLHNDEINGSRIVSMDNCMCKLYNIIRDDSKFLTHFEKELKTPALYILLNKNNSKAYIGETDDFVKRIPQHLAKKDFWTEVMVFVGGDDSLTKTEVQYLEFLALEKANKAKSYDLSENTQSGKEPHMNYIVKGKTEKFFSYVQFLIKFVGCDIFEKRPGVAPSVLSGISKAKVLPVPISVKSEDLAGRISLSLNGNGKYSKREFVWHVVDEFIRTYPDTTFDELRATFKRDYLLRFARFEFLENDINSAKNWEKLGLDHCSYFVKDEEILRSADGVEFSVCVEWDKNNLLKVLGLVKALGWDFEIIK